MAAGYLSQLSGGPDRSPVGQFRTRRQDQPGRRPGHGREGIDIAAERPKILTTEAVKASDVVITMGCGDTCPYYPGKRYEDWVLGDPAGQDLNHVRPIRDQIRRRVESLINELLP